MDDSVSLLYCSVTDNNYIPKNACDDDTGLCHFTNFGLFGNDASLFEGIFLSFRVVSNHSVEGDTKRIFRIGDFYVLFHLKTIEHQFGMKYNICNC